MKIKTEQLPTGEWSAIDDDTYDAQSDSVGSWSTSPVGYGSTEAAAVLELRELIEEKENATGIRHGMRRHKESCLSALNIHPPKVD